MHKDFPKIIDLQAGLVQLRWTAMSVICDTAKPFKRSTAEKKKTLCNLRNRLREGTLAVEIFTYRDPINLGRVAKLLPPHKNQTRTLVMNEVANWTSAYTARAEACESVTFVSVFPTFPSHPLSRATPWLKVRNRAVLRVASDPRRTGVTGKRKKDFCVIVASFMLFVRPPRTSFRVEGAYIYSVGTVSTMSVSSVPSRVSDLHEKSIARLRVPHIHILSHTHTHMHAHA